MALLWSAKANACSLLGDTIGAHQALDDWQRDDPRSVARFRELVSAFGSPTAPAGGEPRPVIEPMIREDTQLDLITLGLAGSDVELADALGQPGLAANALAILVEGYERGVRFSAGWCTFVPRLAGVACLLAGDHHEAVEW